MEGVCIIHDRELLIYLKFIPKAADFNVISSHTAISEASFVCLHA